jgi:hypothetical protein
MPRSTPSAALQPRWPRFRFSAEAYLAIAASMPEGSYAARRDDRGGYAIILDRMVLDHLKAMRAPGESYNDVILRLAKGESGEE